MFIYMKTKLLNPILIYVFAILFLSGCKKQDNSATIPATDSTKSLENTEETSTGTKTNLLDTMDDDEWRKLNIFVSNFCESNLDNFSTNNYDEKALIGFALSHNVNNNRESFKTDENGDSYVPKTVVNNTIDKYFGIKNIPAKDFEEDFYACKGGKYYWLDVMEGSPWFAGGQAVQLYDNGDGTLSVIVENYQDGEGYGMDEASILPNNPTSPFYAPKKNWSGKVKKLLRQNGYYIATIAPYTYNDKQTYKLLEWRFVETPDAI